MSLFLFCFVKFSSGPLASHCRCNHLGDGSAADLLSVSSVSPVFFSMLIASRFLELNLH
jgi:hypothetical protein